MTQIAPPDTDPAAQLVRYKDGGDNEIALSVNFVREYFCKKATPVEAFGFIRFCEYHQLNPFLRDAHLIKYDERDPAQMVIGYHVWIQRADTDPRYGGFRAGVILETGAGLERRQGAFYVDGETLLGGWCEVTVKGREPARVEVTLKEYDRQRALWKTHKATMIQKVATAQAFRFAFPRIFAGAYDQAEVGPNGPLPDQIITIEMPTAVEDPVGGQSTEPTWWDKFLDWLASQDRNLADVALIMEPPVNPRTVYEYIKSNGLKVSGFMARLEDAWANGYADEEPDAA